MTSKQLNADIDVELAEVLGDANPTIGDEELITMIRLIANNARPVDDGVDHIPGMVIARLIAAYRATQAELARVNADVAAMDFELEWGYEPE